MAHDPSGREVPTRREYLKYGAVVGGGLLAGCLGDGEGSTPASESTAPETASATAESGTTATDGPYTVTMAPMGEVEFEAVPESVFTRLTHLADMAVALGRGDGINAMHAPEYYHALWTQFTERLPGVSLDWRGLYSSWKVSKEKLYELDSDVHLADPASVAALGSWDRDDLREIEENIGPWFGNSFSDGNRELPAAWADDYEYYELWEMFGKVAEVFRETERYDALAAVHDDLLSTIESTLPPKAERPTAVMVGSTDIEKMYAYRLDAPGFRTAHTRPLGPVGAFGDEVESGTVVDFEALLEADPDVFLLLAGMHPTVDMGEIRRKLESEPVAREVSAVKSGRVYAQGARYQGPILNLFQLEMTAKQLYPERFGPWPDYENGPYPEIPADERLFDRERVANVINGEF